MNFVHLHNHTHYSLLDGLTKIDEFIAAAKEDGQEALAITDHGVMYGVVEFFQKCKQADIKPIIGVEAYLAPSSRLNKVAKSDEKNYHLLLLAKNNEGYKNLIKLTTIAHLEGFYYKPRIDWEVLQKYHRGLIASTACLSGEIPKLILAGKSDKARKRILEYNELFGQENFYLELMDHPELEDYKKVNDQLIKFSRELNIPLVATNDIHYLKKEDDEAQDILLCLQNKKKKEDTNRMKMMGKGDYSMRSRREMVKIFSYIPEAIENTVKIAEKCNLKLELGNIQLPFFAVPDGYDGNTYLKELCCQGILKRYGADYKNVDAQIKERMDYELLVIAKMGWSSYFLIVADFVNWAKNNKIIVGPGRGSAAGSLVCYLTGITNIDPLKYNLIFERFLNPERISMPDIDLDFADTRREEVIRYVEEKYGKNHVAQIITFGTMAARAAIRDVGRVLDYPYDYCDKLAKMIPMFSKIDKALKNVSELREIYKEEAARKIIDYAKKLEGVARHASTHACGVLITKKPLTEYVSLQHASSSDKSIVSQYSLHPIEDLGLLKMDFLGLKNLTIIESAIKIIKNTRALDINIDNIPLDDKKTYKLFKAGETTGVFQLESSGMKRYLRELKPTEFEDIIAMVSLYRPGPMEWIPDYIAGKHKKKKVSYLHQKLEPILAKTYGVAIYQEQVMQIARDLAGFTMGEADVLRKAVGKKIPELLAKQKEKFIDGCVKNSIAEELAKKIFSFIEPFAGYGFNRSHAACYALIGYQTAYLKAHWPTEFMAALLAADQQNTDRVAIEIEECRSMGIGVMPPDINESFGSFTVVTSGTKENKSVGQSEDINTIRFGLKAVKNVGEHIADEIINERKINGPYKNIFDFLERVTDRDLNKKSLESLIKSGGLDGHGERAQLIGNIDRLLNFNKEASKAKNNKQNSLFVDAPNLNLTNRIELVAVAPTQNREELLWEKELLGLYITEHPFNDYKEQLKDVVVPLVKLHPSMKGKYVDISGIISNIKKIITRSNESMLFVKIEDSVGSIEILVFPNLLKKTPDLWQEGKIIICNGKISDKDQEVKILVNRARELTINNISKSIDLFKLDKNKNGFNNGINNNHSFVSGSQSSIKRPINREAEPKLKCGSLNLIFNKKLRAEELDSLKNLFLKYSGNNKVILKFNDSGQNNVVETGFMVNNSNELINEINNSFKNIIIDKN